MREGAKGEGEWRKGRKGRGKAAGEGGYEERRKGGRKEGEREEGRGNNKSYIQL